MSSSRLKTLHNQTCTCTQSSFNQQKKRSRKKKDKAKHDKDRRCIQQNDERTKKTHDDDEPQYDTYVKLMTTQDEAKLLARGVEHNGLPSSLFPSQIHLEAEEKGKGIETALQCIAAVSKIIVHIWSSQL